MTPLEALAKALHDDDQCWPNVDGCRGPHDHEEAQSLLSALAADGWTVARKELLTVANIMRRHTHYEDTPGAQTTWVMSRFAGRDCLHDCLLCRALVGAGVLTLDDIGVGTRQAIEATR